MNVPTIPKCDRNGPISPDPINEKMPMANKCRYNF